ncbi:pectin lyase-like protein [Mycena rebaudengoi]|nr:pectin lyase-like protein [Mycena rebaudengoi]
MRLTGYLAIFAAFVSSCSALLAFPGAEGERWSFHAAGTGFGAQSTGGRGGAVYIVTNLNDSGTGSFRDAVSQPHRIVVFSVGGLITITSRIVVSHDIYIAGQTAPGQGITVYGNGLSYSNANNTITRYIRYRMGTTGDSGKDTITIADGANMIFDHVSVSWGRDETFSINGAVSNITISDSIIAQGLQTHSCGGLIQTDGGVSILRTLYIDNQTRNPKVKGVNDFVNNVVYNWGGGGGYIAGDSAGPSEANIINNVFLRFVFRQMNPALTRGNANFHTFVSNNLYDPDQDGTFNGFILSPTTDNYSDVDFQSARYPYPTVGTLLSPADAFAKVRASAGASKSRDHVDTYLINTELGSLGKVGAIITNPLLAPINGPGPITGGTAPVDTDKDGIPDAYELQHGLNPNVNDSANIASNGYSNIENYVNSLV